MPRIFELFGHPLTDTSPEALRTRQSAYCPFMNQECDGGGNRELSRITLATNPSLRDAFPLHTGTTVAAGICSIQVQPDTDPWIVCPRRLLALGRESAGTRIYQDQAEKRVLRSLDYSSGTRLGIWTEVKLKTSKIINTDEESISKVVDYTFDYILMPIGQVAASDAMTFFEPDATWKKVKRMLEKSGYTVNSDVIEDFPLGNPSIIEIMTSSTSGGNKTKRTTISAAFEDAILERDHQAPGINYRQVWARMVSQLIVKSEFAIGWNGKAIWILQDKLLNYIGSSTALMLKEFMSHDTSDVNLLSFTYQQSYQNKQGVIDLTEAQLYAGTLSHISGTTARSSSIQDIIRAPFIPERTDLIRQLARRAPVNYVIVP